MTSVHQPNGLDTGASRIAEISSLLDQLEAAEEERSSRVRMVSAFIGDAPLCLMVCSRNAIIMCSDTSEELFGVSPDNMFGTSLLARAHPDDVARLADLIDSLNTRSADGGLYRFATGSGDFVRCSIEATRFDQDGLSFVKVRGVDSE